MDKYFNLANIEKQNDLGADVHGNGTVSDETNTIRYRYQEMHVSRSQRGISLTITEQRGGIHVTPKNHQYDISPNPHKDPYYDGHEANFYAILAQESMKEVIQKQEWPNRIRVRNRHFNETYTLE